eukprot:SAG22_NODE_1349_length_4655_cov_6.900132_1_plen_117_part_10
MINDKTLRGFVTRNHDLDAAAAAPAAPFTVSCINPATQAGRAGFRVLQQQRTLQLSTLHVARRDDGDGLAAGAGGSWAVATSNVRRFRFAQPAAPAAPALLQIDGAAAPLAVEAPAD